MAEYSYCLGQKWEYVEATMTMWMLDAYGAYFADCPPTHVLAAAYVNYAPPTRAEATAELPDMKE